MKLLVVDDDPTLLKALTRLLEVFDFDVTPSNDPEDALVKASTDHFDAILSDFHMPQMTGGDLYNSLRARNPQAAQRMVFMSGNPKEGAAARFFKGVPNPVLTKPFDVDDLWQAIRAS